jgi:hypothetical protein
MACRAPRKRELRGIQMDSMEKMTSKLHEPRFWLNKNMGLSENRVYSQL